MNKIKRVKLVGIQTRWVYQQGIYLASPLTIMHRAQLDTRIEAIVIKVTIRKREMKRLPLQKVQVDDLLSIGPVLHYAPVDDFHHSGSTKRTWPLRLPVGPRECGDLEPGHRYFVGKFPRVGWHPSGLATHIQEGHASACASAKESVCVFLVWSRENTTMPYCTELLVGLLQCLHIIFCLVVLHFHSQKCTFTEVPLTAPPLKCVLRPDFEDRAQKKDALLFSSSAAWTLVRQTESFVGSEDYFPVIVACVAMCACMCMSTIRTIHVLSHSFSAWG